MNKEDRNKYIKQWRENHKEESKQWRENNKDDINKYKKQWYEKHKEELKKYNKERQKSNMASIYTITNITNNKVYIGSTKLKPNVRWSGHKCDAQSKRIQLYIDMMLLGIDKFIFKVEYTCDKERAHEEEQLLLDKIRKIGIETYNTYNPIGKNEYLRKYHQRKKNERQSNSTHNIY